MTRLSAAIQFLETRTPVAHVPFTLGDILVGVVVPAAAAAILAAVLRVVTRFGRQGAAWSVAVGFAGGVWLFSWLPLVPRESWQWLPYLACGAAILGPLSSAQGVGWWERQLGLLLLAISEALVLVPSWSSLETVRHWHYLALASILYLLSGLLLPLARPVAVGSPERGDRTPEAGSRATANAVEPSGAESRPETREDKRADQGLAWSLPLTSLAASVLLVMSGSLKFAQLGGAAFFATAGCLAGLRFFPREAELRGLVPLWSAVTGGLIYTGYVQSFSSIPWFCYLLVAAAPLACWIPRAWAGSPRAGAAGVLPYRAGWSLVPLAVALVIAYRSAG